MDPPSDLVLRKAIRLLQLRLVRQANNTACSYDQLAEQLIENSRLLAALAESKRSYAVVFNMAITLLTMKNELANSDRDAMLSKFIELYSNSLGDSEMLVHLEAEFGELLKEVARSC